MFSPMGSIGGYMFRAIMGAFLITLVSLTVVIWFTQAMRDFDLITSQRQTLLVFVGITGMIVPLLIMMLAPIALVMAAAHVLNKLSSDSEIIVMNAAGVSPWRLRRCQWPVGTWPSGCPCTDTGCCAGPCTRTCTACGS